MDMLQTSLENKKPVYVTACTFPINGLFSIFHVCLSHIMYAFDNGYIPVIDLQHYYNQYFKDGRIFKDNVWEYFFKQPANISLDDIGNNPVIIGENILIYHCFNDIENACFEILSNPQKCKEFEKYFNVIQFNAETEKFLIEKYKEITGGETEILGILCRGTDYMQRRPKEHFIQPDVCDVIKKAKELFNRFNYKKIWLATEDCAIYEKFKAEFGDLLLDNKQYKYGDTKNNLLARIKVERKDHTYNLAKEYMLSIYILSRCKYLIGGCTSAMVGLACFSNGFKEQKYTAFWNIGRYSHQEGVEYNNFFERILSYKRLIKEDAKYKILTIFGLKIPIFKISYKNRMIVLDRTKD